MKEIVQCERCGCTKHEHYGCLIHNSFHDREKERKELEDSRAAQIKAQ